MGALGAACTQGSRATARSLPTAREGVLADTSRMGGLVACPSQAVDRFGLGGAFGVSVSVMMIRLLPLP